jgi:hypothetical protein
MMHMVDDPTEDYLRFDRMLHEAAQYRVLKMVFESDKDFQDKIERAFGERQPGEKKPSLD